MFSKVFIVVQIWDYIVKRQSYILFKTRSKIKVSAIEKSEMALPFPKRQILDSSKLKAFADDNFKFLENDRKFFEQVENTVELEASASLHRPDFSVTMKGRF